MLYRHDHSPVEWRQFLSWGFLLQSDSRSVSTWLLKLSVTIAILILLNNYLDIYIYATESHFLVRAGLKLVCIAWHPWSWGRPPASVSKSTWIAGVSCHAWLVFSIFACHSNEIMPCKTCPFYMCKYFAFFLNVFCLFCRNFTIACLFYQLVYRTLFFFSFW